MKKSRVNQREKKSAWTYGMARLRTSIRTLHEDTRGAISVLVLLTLWCLVALVGMVMNTTEQARRREEIQTAADAGAHSAATWMSRTVNTVTGQNLIICQDASAETIWRAIPPALREPTAPPANLRTPTNPHFALYTELDYEVALAQQMEADNQFPALVRRLQQDLSAIAEQYQLTSDALTILSGESSANYANPQEAATYQFQIRQAMSGMNWVNNTYVNGQPAPAPPRGARRRPGPPGPNGEGLAQLVTKWRPQPEASILDAIIAFINGTERPIADTFQRRTADVVSQPVDTHMAAAEAAIFQNEKEVVNQLPDTIEAQRAQLAAFYQTDITLATLKNTTGSSGPARVVAPLIAAGDVPSVTGYVDAIRAANQSEAALQNLPLSFPIDPINPQSGDAKIWYPEVPIPINPAVVEEYPSLGRAFVNATLLLNANFPDGNGWGHIWAMPLEHYFRQRVNRDMQDINTQTMIPLDQSRNVTLAQLVRSMLGIAADNTTIIASLPPSIAGDVPVPVPPPPPPVPPAQPVIPRPRYQNVPLLPRLVAPSNAGTEYRSEIDIYNQRAAAYVGAVRSLYNDLISYTVYFNFFTTAFAQQKWHDEVVAQATLVLQNLGKNKQFMVLSTYGLRSLPDPGGMFQSAAIALENQIVLINIDSVTQTIVQDLIDSDPDQLGTGYLDPTARHDVLYTAYIGRAAGAADAIVRPAAHSVALAIASEWIRRPWPYEITPPEGAVPPYRGITPADRMREFTVLAAARQTDATTPRVLLPAIFGDNSGKLSAYAQAEAFNWMEFNSNYGGGERFDQVVYIPDVIYWISNRSSNIQEFVGSPRGWRTGSIGGWNWRSRLSLSDALSPALQANDEMRQYLQDAGITNPMSGTLNEINLH